MSRQWRIAVVGTGVVGEWHVRTVPKVPNCQLVAVCDIEPAKCRAALDKNKMNVPVYADALEMNRKENIDSVHVCTPSGDHMGPVLTAIEHGKNVVCEKPMEIQLDRIDRMIEAAKKKGVKLAGIFQNRWNEANAALRQAVQENRFGRIAWAGAITPWYRTDQSYEEGGW